jgi:hypothetical protein
LKKHIVLRNPTAVPQRVFIATPTTAKFELGDSPLGTRKRPDTNGMLYQLQPPPELFQIGVISMLFELCMSARPHQIQSPCHLLKSCVLVVVLVVVVC